MDPQKTIREMSPHVESAIATRVRQACAKPGISNTEPSRDTLSRMSRGLLLDLGHPDLLAACKQIEEDLAIFQSKDANYLSPDIVAEHLNRIRAAIAKAEGR